MSREVVYISTPLESDRLDIRDTNIQRLKRISSKLSSAGYHPIYAPIFAYGLDRNTYQNVAFHNINVASRILVVPHNTGLLSCDVWRDIAYAKMSGTSVVKFRNERDLYRWLNVNIFTFSGASGSGKNRIAKEILDKRRFDFNIVPSVTTRLRHPSDLPGEYLHVSFEEFLSMEDNEEFLWTADIDGGMYGITKQAIDVAVQSEKKSIMIIPPDVLDVLYEYAEGKVWSFYVLSPSEKTLLKRLEQEGEDLSSVRKRIKECKRLDKKARKLRNRYIYIRNEKDLSATISDIQLYFL
ncbi:MAG: hypothetical protein R3346_02280 [Candidatus Spechtbacterales bacterium]|nr:hypothetical protein [Candidatus Spechtbacterales bacterium]